MALTKASIKKAHEIFLKVNPEIQGEIGYFNNIPKGAIPADMIISYDRKQDGGYEGTFTVIRDMTPEQKELWDKLRVKVPNTSVFEPKESELTDTKWPIPQDSIRIGFF